jgi:small-conductance mechanosensitive channel
MTPLLITLTLDDAFWDDVLHTGLRVVLVLVVALVGLWLLQRILNPVIRVAIREQMIGQPEIEVTKRIDTLSHVLSRTALALIVVLVIVTLLPEFGVNAAPMIASLGLVGLAVGFGAQNLVKDIINGVFILVENQYGRNDVVTIAGITGLVEDINLRRTILRDLDGTVHFIPHSQIETASNWTKGFSRINLNVAVSYSTDLDHAIEVINRVGHEMAEDPDLAHKLKTPPSVLRVDRLGDSAIELKVVAETLPLEQWGLMGELRLRLKRAFDAEGIVIPFPQRTVHVDTVKSLVKDGTEAGAE